MGSALSVRMLPLPLRTLAFGSITASYVAIGNAFEFPVRIIYLQNLTDVTLKFSFDGVTDHLVLPTNGFILLDVTANKNMPQGFSIAQGTKIYVTRIGTPSTGSVYLSAFYGFTGNV